MLKRAIPIILAFVMMMSLPLAANAASGSDDGLTKLTAKQIITQMKKTTPIKKIKNIDTETKKLVGRINNYSSKYNFYDKKYKKVYCTVEVFKNKDDAIRRAAYIDSLKMLYDAFGMKEDVPLTIYQYKNVVVRVGSNMPYKRAKKYYNAMKKIVNKSITKPKKETDAATP